MESNDLAEYEIPTRLIVSDAECEVSDTLERRKRKASDDVLESRKRKAFKDGDMLLHNLSDGEGLHLNALSDTENLHFQVSIKNENSHLDASNEGETLPLETSQEGESLQLEASNETGNLHLEASNEGESFQLESLNEIENLQVETLNEGRILQLESLNETGILQLDASNETEILQLDASDVTGNLQVETLNEGRILRLEPSNETGILQLDASDVTGNLQVETLNEGRNLRLEASNEGESFQLESLNETGILQLDASNETGILQLDASNVTGNLQAETLNEGRILRLEPSNETGILHLDASDVTGNLQVETLNEGGILPLEASNEGESFQLESLNEIGNLPAETLNEGGILPLEASSDEENVQLEATSDTESVQLETLSGTANFQLEVSSHTESMQLVASSYEDIQPCTVETVRSLNWYYGTKTICGFIWSRNSDAAADDEMSRGSKPIGIQLTSSSIGGQYCKFLVDAKLRSPDVIWEMMPFEKKKESERLQLFKRSSEAIKRRYVDLFPKTTTLQTDILNDTTHDLTVTIKRTTYREATIEWTSDAPDIDRWLIIIRNEGRTPRQSTDPVRDSEWMILLTPSDDKSLNKIDQSLVSLEYEAGHRYTVAVYGLREEKIFEEIGRYINVANSTTSFRAEHTKEDLKKLLVMAREVREHMPKNTFRQARRHVSYATTDFMRCQWLYRDKPKEYFRELKMLNDNIMKVYDKDANGDPASVIHGQLKGLFFSANVYFNSGEPMRPIFGDVRVMIPALKMLREDWKIYFADLYCLNTTHLVTLVLAEPDSEADKFCAQKLICLSRTDRCNNPFLFVSDDTVYVSSRITVEVFYTKDINLKLLESEYSGILKEFDCWENRRNGEKWKNENCPTCNLYTSHLLDDCGEEFYLC